MEICNNCILGEVPTVERRVTREMALDAGQPELEGMSLGIDTVRCSCCMGDWQNCPNCSADEVTEDEPSHA